MWYLCSLTMMHYFLGQDLDHRMDTKTNLEFSIYLLLHVLIYVCTLRHLFNTHPVMRVSLHRGSREKTQKDVDENYYSITKIQSLETHGSQDVSKTTQLSAFVMILY